MMGTEQDALELGQQITRVIGDMLLDPDYNPVLRLPVYIPGYDFGDGKVDGARGTFTIRIGRPDPDSVEVVPD